jgi:hypothetical protein
MATGKPFPSKDAKLQVAAIPVAPATPVWKDVGTLTAWDSDANEELAETDVFHQDDPLTTVGRERVNLRLTGLLADNTDDGQGLINTHVGARDYFLVQILWDGVNGFLAQARNSSRTKSGRAGNSFAEASWSFSLLSSTIEIVGDGPVL